MVWVVLLAGVLWGCRDGRGGDEVPVLVTAVPPDSALLTLTAVPQAVAAIPPRDSVALYQQFYQPDTPLPAPPATDTEAVGDSRTFFVVNLAENRTDSVSARLVFQSAQLKFWVEEGADVDMVQLQAAAERLETAVLPTTRQLFGQEPQPGIDNDPRLNILHVRQLHGPGIAYFSAANELPAAVNPKSNQREMLIVSLAAAPVGSNTYFSTIAHELQHLIQWANDPNEDGWVNEGLAELSVYVNGLPVAREATYAEHPDIQLTNLQQDPAVIAYHYAASFLFHVYFLDRFGEALTQQLVQHPANGVAGIDAVLQANQTGVDFEALFGDWLVANYLQGLKRPFGVYGYASLALPLPTTQEISRLPASGTSTVNQYGADYFRVESDTPFTFSFTGSRQTRLAAANPHSGDFYWLSLPGDASDMRLTRRFDLSGLTSATLRFWTWYEIEAGWDYGYVAVSADNGRSWQLLATEATTQENPNGNSFGPAFTGNSGNGRQPVWIEQTADLTPFVGQPVLIRFEYITDDAVHLQGFALDDISIPELGFHDDVEQGENGWQAEGFIRTGGVLPQQFLARQILISDAEVRVSTLSIDESQQGEWFFPMDTTWNTAIIIIAGTTPLTSHPAAYAYSLTPSKR